MRRPLERARILRRTDDRPPLTLPAAVRRILRKYPTTLLLPGPSGILQYGFQPGNYRESTGQMLAAADQQVGLVVDAAQSPTVLYSDDFSSSAGWTLGTGWGISGGLLRHIAAGTAAATYAFPTTVGKTYLVEFDIADQSVADAGVSFRYGFSAALAVRSGIASYREVFQSIGSTTIIGFIARGGSGGWIGGIDNLRLIELPGSHVIQATSGYQSYLRQAGGVNSWQLDGVDDRLPLSSLPLASGDDFYQAFALRCAVSGSNKTFADLLTNPTTGTRLGCLRINSANALQVVHANDAGGVNTVAGRTVIDNQLLVVEAVRAGNSHTVFADGTVDIQTTLSGNYTTTHATIGARGAGTSEPYLGHIHGSIICKGLPSEGERAILRKFLAQLQGRNL